MDIERAKPKPKEAKPKPEQYWVRFRDVTVDDLNALLIIYQNITERGRPPLPVEERDLDRLREDIKSDRAFSELPIGGGLLLETRRRIGRDNELFVRFKITPGTINNRYDNSRIRIALQSGIDAYFLSQHKAIPLRETF